jgi:hypothetical protein
MSQDNKMEFAQTGDVNDAKAKMLAALAKKQKGGNIGKSSVTRSGSKIASGQTSKAAPKMHRRKAGSA